MNSMIKKSKGKLETQSKMYQNKDQWVAAAARSHNGGDGDGDGPANGWRRLESETSFILLKLGGGSGRVKFHSYIIL